MDFIVLDELGYLAFALSGGQLLFHLISRHLSSLKVVGLTHEIAESYAPINITASYAGQDDTPKPFLMIIDWIRVAKDWKIASEIILAVPPSPAAKD
jgi:hypothetical protein